MTLTELSATAAINAMRTGEIKAEDYAQALLDQAEALADLNAFRVIEPERVLASARAADQRRAAGAELGLLHGLPIPIKDSVNTKDYPTTNGTAALRNFRPQSDAAILQILQAQGGFVMGKTNLHEMSIGWTCNNLTFGAVHNPYNPAHSPGGSSGGSAAAVAAGMAPIAIAEDTLGSIRVPAAMCGLCGLRPTFNRYPDGGIMPLTDNKFDQVGPVARQVEDLLLFDTAVTGDSTLLLPNLNDVRIGIPDFFYTDLQPEAEKITLAALNRLRDAGVQLVDIKVSEAIKSVAAIAGIIIYYETPRSIADFLAAENAGISLTELIAAGSPEVKNLLQNISMAENFYKTVRAQRPVVNRAIADLFNRQSLTALAIPPALTLPPKIGEEGAFSIDGRQIDSGTAFGRNVALGSCVGSPSLVLPAGLTADNLPVGIEFNTLPGNDRELLALGIKLQETLGKIDLPKFDLPQR